MLVCIGLECYLSASLRAKLLPLDELGRGFCHYKLTQPVEIRVRKDQVHNTIFLSKRVTTWVEPSKDTANTKVPYYSRHSKIKTPPCLKGRRYQAYIKAWISQNFTCNGDLEITCSIIMLSMWFIYVNLQQSHNSSRVLT